MLKKDDKSASKGQLINENDKSSKVRTFSIEDSQIMSIIDNLSDENGQMSKINSENGYAKSPDNKLNEEKSIKKIGKAFKRYQELSLEIKESVNGLTTSQMTAFALACRIVTAQYRKTWKGIIIEEEYCNFDKFDYYYKISDIRHELEKRMKSLYLEILRDVRLIESLPTGRDPKIMVHLYKLKADYSRYLSEIAYLPSDERKLIDIAYINYKRGLEMAKSYFVPTHPLLVSFALNYSVFLHDCLQDRKKAVNFVNSFMDSALMSLNTMDRSTHQFTIKILQYMKDNLSSWPIHDSPVPSDTYKTGNIQVSDHPPSTMDK